MNSLRGKTMGGVKQGTGPAAITCKVCDTGILVKGDRYVLGRIVGLVGFFLLIPSAAGAALGVLAAIAAGGGAVAMLGDYSDALVGAGLLTGGLVSLGLIAISFVGGLLGFLLIRKKTILQCSNCGAVTPAS